VSFYETYNPSKIQEVDKNLAKYAGNEHQLFMNLAKKYNVDPAQFGVSAQATPPAAGFGNSPAPTFGSQQGFGAPSFGAAGVLGGGAPTGGGFGSSGGVFGSTGGSAGVSSFGSLAASSGSAFGLQSNTGFGSQTPFGAARR
jgi:hypothetical protein